MMDIVKLVLAILIYISIVIIIIRTITMLYEKLGIMDFLKAICAKVNVRRNNK